MGLHTLRGGLHWGPIVDPIQTSPIWTNRMAWIFQIRPKGFTLGPDPSFPSYYMAAYMAQKWRQTFGPTQGNWVKVWGGPISQHGPDCLKFISTIQIESSLGFKGFIFWDPNVDPNFAKWRTNCTDQLGWDSNRVGPQCKAFLRWWFQACTSSVTDAESEGKAKWMDVFWWWPYECPPWIMHSDCSPYAWNTLIHFVQNISFLVFLFGCMTQK
jgi:hypothetical protein